MSFGFQTLGFMSGGVPPLEYINASGGTVTTDGDYKVHTFTSPGTFAVTSIGETAVPSTFRDKISYTVIAGGGGSGGRHGAGAGGGGAGGFRANNNDAGGDFSPESPLAAPVSTFTVSASPGSYPISVGSGGARVDGYNDGNPGGASSGFSITSAGGGGGGYNNGPVGTNGKSGGSGGGGGRGGSAGSPGTGNSPSTSPPQGQNGGGSGGSPGTLAGSGGGAGGAGQSAWPAQPGPGTPHGISGSDVTYCRGGNPGQPTGNLGHGGGWASSELGDPGNDGVVIVRYRVSGTP